MLVTMVDEEAKAILLILTELVYIPPVTFLKQRESLPIVLAIPPPRGQQVVAYLGPFLDGRRKLLVQPLERNSHACSSLSPIR
jgi:hypothetical protein